MSKLIDYLKLKTIWRILSPSERRQSITIFLLMLVGMILETLGVGLVIPALALMLTTNVETSFPKLSPLLQMFGNPTNQQIIIAGMLLLVSAYTVKTAFLAFLTSRQMQFLFGVQVNLSERLFSGYLSQPYCFHLQRNSAELVRNITREATLFSQDGFLGAMTLLTECMVIFGISMLLIWIEPWGAVIVVSTLGSVAWCANTILRRRTIIWGEKRQRSEGLRLKCLMEGLGGVKDVKILGCKEEFVRGFRLLSAEWARMGRRQATLLLMPRLVLELFAVIGIAVLVIVMIARGCTPSILLPTLGIFAAAAFRIMPSFSRIMTALQSLQHAFPVVDTIDEELRMLEKPISSDATVAEIDFETSIRMEGVSFQYATAPCPALNEINIQILKGTSVGFIGESGAGKSTLVDILIGLLEPSFGAVKLDGVDIRTGMVSWQRKIGYIPQSIFLKDDSLLCNVAFGVAEEQIDVRAVELAVRLARLDEFVGSLPGGLETEVGERGVRLSGGQRQRIGIARALYHNPEVLVLDEATSALDVQTESEVMGAVNALHGQKTIIIVAHRMSTVERCDRLYRLEAGRIVAAGTPADLLYSKRTNRSGTDLLSLA